MSNKLSHWRYPKLKKYRIHIIPAPALKDCIWETPYKRNALIVCTNRYEHIVQKLPIKEKLVMVFPDVEDKHYPGAFGRAHARRIMWFLLCLPRSVTDLYICCSKGGSRSAGVAAAVLRMSGRSDKRVWCNPYYVPNLLVYYRLCREYHLFTPWCYVKWLNHINQRAYRKSQERHHAGGYERWQIIE